MTEITPTALRRSTTALALFRFGLAALLCSREGDARLVGARELGLGAGTLDALRRGAPVSGWVGAMAIADGTDALLYCVDAARSREGRTRSLALAAFAASGLVGESLTAYALRRAGE